MGVSAVAAVIGAATVTHQVEQSNVAKRQAKRAENNNAIVEGRAKKKQAEQEKISNIERIRRSERSRQKALAAGKQGRQSTILGGAPSGDASAGNVGNQSQSSSGKTLLGV